MTCQVSSKCVVCAFANIYRGVLNTPYYRLQRREGMRYGTAQIRFRATGEVIERFFYSAFRSWTT